jgi:MoxR-like ATPase
MTADGTSPAPPPTSAGAVPAVPSPTELLTKLTASIGEDVIGSAAVVRALMIALVAEGHVLLEGVPGLAKTYLVRTFSRRLGLGFHRIQFTPDMLPTDILGAMILKGADRTFEFRPGPIFSNIILADEINRAPPKVQSALLEAMQERQVTIEGTSHPLPRPFVVIATQNPVEQEGTYPLPEAELDRFLFRWVMRYPSASDEVTILKSRDTRPDDGEVIAPTLDPAAIARLGGLLKTVHLHDDVYRYLTAVVRRTREDRNLLLGASPRASVHFLQAVRAAALLEGRDYVIPDDVRGLAFAVLNHRVILRPEALSQASGISGSFGAFSELERILRETLDAVEVPR